MRIFLLFVLLDLVSFVCFRNYQQNLFCPSHSGKYGNLKDLNAHPSSSAFDMHDLGHTP